MYSNTASARTFRSGIPPPVSCNFTRSLFNGISGEDVKCLQRYLNSSGFTLALTGPGSPGSETSYFGSITEAGVIRWQAANNVSPAIGYFGPISRTKYIELAGGKIPPPPPPPPGDNFTQTLYIGISSPQVTLLQQFFAKNSAIYPEALVTGYYGTLTEAAVKKFQAKYGIVSSGSPSTTGYGLVGPKTREKLNEIYPNTP